MVSFTCSPALLPRLPYPTFPCYLCCFFCCCCAALTSVFISLLFQVGATALHSAACYGYTAVCSLLLEKGADIHAKNQVSDADMDIYCMQHTYPSPSTWDLMYPICQRTYTHLWCYQPLLPHRMRKKSFAALSLLIAGKFVFHSSHCGRWESSGVCIGPSKNMTIKFLQPANTCLF